MTRRSIIGSACALALLAACAESVPPLGTASDRVSTRAAATTTITLGRTSLDPVESTATTAAAAPTSLTATTSSSSSSSTTTTSLVESVIPTAAPPPAANADEPIIEVGSIEIPAIGVAKTMYEGVSLGVLDHGPGHWPGTAMPGQNGNMVIAGHRMSHDRPFRDVDLLAPGDEVIVSDSAGGRFVYLVTSTEVVTPDAMWILDPTPTPTATLFACHPKGSTRQRIVVHLELAPG